LSAISANPVSALVRAALLVSNLQRSTRFYKDFLGLNEH
jgi:catechol 2,3-dioxygenase-like lactoylglutathione lyase family enzyme